MSAQTRIITVIEALSGTGVAGARLTEIVGAIDPNALASTILRDLETLQSVGWAVQDAEKRWRLAARPMQLLFNFQAGLSSARQRLDQIEHNYTREPA